MTAAVVAATHPQADVVAVDGMPEHIAHARELCASAGISNLALHRADFGSADLRALPLFDYIVAHGVYTWVSADVRAHLRTLIDQHLKPGGLVYVSYNALPGWAADLPLQRVLLELAAAGTGDSNARFAAAAGVVERMTDAGARALLASPLARAGLAERRKRIDGAYFPHEFLPAAWQPLYVTDVRNDFAQIGLEPIASATIRDNFDTYTLKARWRDALATVEEPNLRELLRDFFRSTPFRRDVFGRDVRVLEDAERRARIFAMTFQLARPRDQIDYRMPTVAGEVGFDTAAAHHVVASLAGGPRQLARIGDAPLPAEDVLANTVALCAADDVRPVASRPVPVENLNRTLAAEAFGYRVSPHGTAIRIAAAPDGASEADAQAWDAAWDRFFDLHGMGLTALGHARRGSK